MSAAALPSRRAPSGSAPGRRRRPPRPRLLALAAACCLLAPWAPPAGAISVTWTGGAPIFFWYDPTNYTNPSGEVADALDCAGINNAGLLRCDTYSFWGYAGNWGGALPGAGDEVHIVSAAEVDLSFWSSPIRGNTAPSPLGSFAAISQSGGGSLYIAKGGALHTVGADIDRLQLNGQLYIDGSATINQVSNTADGVFFNAGLLRGNGSTTVHNGTGFGAADAQHVTLDGYMPLGAQVTLYDDAVLTNSGNITGGLEVRNYGSTLGGNGYSALRAFQNLGVLTVSTASANGRAPRIEIDTQFFNQAAVQLGLNGQLFSLAGGIHAGSASFSGGAQSTMQFAGFHSFAAGSSIDSSGTVTFGGTPVADLPVGVPFSQPYGFHNQVSGSYRAATTLVFNNTVFEGPADPGALSASALTVLLDPAKLTLPSVTLNGGALIGHPAIDVSGSLQLHGASGLGTYGGVTALAGISFDGSGTKTIGDYQEPSSWVANRALATLTGGPLQLLPHAAFINVAGARFDLQGDYDLVGDVSASGTSSERFDNAGLFVKSAGSGVSTVTTAFNNSGSVQVDSGTLRLLGGGTQTGTWSAASLIQFGGAQVFQADTTLGPNVGFYGPASLTVAHSVTLSSDAQNLAQQNSAGGALALINHGTFVNNAGAMLGGGIAITNDGRFANAGTVYAGPITNSGDFSSAGELRAGVITNSAGFAIVGSGRVDAASLLNQAGNFSIAAGSVGNSLSLVVNAAQLSNAGWLQIDTLSNGVGASFVNSGYVVLGDAAGGTNHVNLGSLVNTGNFTLTGGTLNPGQFVNDGQLVINLGTLWLGAGEAISGAGSLTQIDGLTRVDGSLTQAGGLWLQGGTLAGLGIINADVHVSGGGRITPGNSPGTLTLNGDLTIEAQPVYNAGAPALVFEVVDTQIHDRLVVHGAAAIGGGIVSAQVLWQGATAPDLDDSFDILSASAGVSGVETLAFSVGGLGAEWQAQASSDGNTVTLSFVDALAYQITAAGPLGGENHDAIVIAAADYAYNLADGFLNYGEIDNAGRFYNRVGGSLYNIGALSNAAAGYLQNRGTLANSGQIDNAGTFVNHADGMLGNGDGIDRAASGQANAQILNRSGAQMRNDGQWLNRAYATLLNQGTFVNNGSLENHGLIRNDGGSFRVTAAGSVSGDGVYLHGNGATTTVDGRLGAGFIGLEGGTLQGTGTLQAQGTAMLFQNWVGQGLAVAGVNIVPGSGALGRLSVEGNLTAVGDKASTLTIALGANGQSSQLAVSGDLQYWGNVVFEFIGGATPQLGSSYTWLTAASGGYSFGEVSLLSLAADGSSTQLAGPYWQWVGENDRRGYLGFDFDGRTEYAIWNIDGSTATLSFSDTLTPVPEPAAWMQWAGGLAVLLGTAARRRRRPRAGAVW